MTIKLIQSCDSIHDKNEIFNLLSQLTYAPLISTEHFESILNGLNNNHQIFVYCKDNKIVGLITLLIEQKLIHNGACVAHIEDLVVDKKYNGQGIATELIDFCLKQTEKRNCYKIILSCKRELITFYEKSGFIENNIQMTKYFS